MQSPWHSPCNCVTPLQAFMAHSCSSHWLLCAAMWCYHMTTFFYTLCDRGAFIYLSIFSSTISEISLRAYLGIPVLCHEMSVQADLLTQPCLKPVHCPIAVAMAKLYSYKSGEVHDWPKQQAPVDMISLFVVWHRWQGQHKWVLSPVFICNALQVLSLYFYML